MSPSLAQGNVPVIILRAQRRLAWITKNGPCSQCGSIENLQVGKIEPGTKVDSQVWHWPEDDKREHELADCRVFCHKCHCQHTRIYSNDGRLRKPKTVCVNCGAVSRSSAHMKYCGKFCEAEHHKKQIIEAWLSGEVSGIVSNGHVSHTIRNYLIQQAGNKCPRCGWAEVHPKTKKVPLQINHIDGRWQNARPENLEVLCPNCHALTENWGGGNKGKGNGRQWRVKFHQDHEFVNE